MISRGIILNDSEVDLISYYSEDDNQEFKLLSVISSKEIRCFPKSTKKWVVKTAQKRR